MEKTQKIYTDDRNVPYKTTRLSALQSRSEIDGILAKFGIKFSGWCWEPEKNNIYVSFSITEKIEGETVNVSVKVAAPLIYNRTGSNKGQINWAVSLRTMYWLIKANLETAYLWNTSRTAIFLPNLLNEQGQTFSQLLVPQLRGSRFAALPQKA